MANEGVSENKREARREYRDPLKRPRLFSVHSKREGLITQIVGN